MNDINIYIYSCIYGLNQSFFFYSYNIFLLLTRNIINYVNFIFFFLKLFSRKYASARLLKMKEFHLFLYALFKKR